MKLAKLTFIFLFLCCSAISAKAENSAELVIGENLKVGMSLVDAFTLLGLPESINVKRGTASEFDSIAVEYPKHGIVIHALTAGTAVEGIEVGRKFTGRFKTGIKVGDDFRLMIEKYGVPDSLESGVANYPDRQLFFILNKEKIVSAKIFTKDTKLLGNRLAASKK